MKKASLILSLLLICAKISAQSIIFKDAAEISKQEFDQHLPAGWLMCESLQKKVRHRVVIKTPKKIIILNDDGEMKQYFYGCDLPGTHLTLVHEMEPKEEEYYLINRQTGTIDTLVGDPVFYPGSKIAVCLEGSGTYKTQRIQIGEVKNGRFRTKFFFELKDEVHPGYIYWRDKHTLFLNDNSEKFYKNSEKFYKLIF